MIFPLANAPLQHLPPRPSQPYSELSLPLISCRRLSAARDMVSVTGKITPFYQPLLNNHHRTMRFSLLLCCHRADVDILRWSSTTRCRKTRLNLLLSSSLTSPRWNILTLSAKEIIHLFAFKRAENEQQSSV